MPNLAIVRPGADGKLSIRLFSSAATGSADVIVDVFGWIATSANPDRGARLVPVTPGRIYDSRDVGSGIQHQHDARLHGQSGEGVPAAPGVAYLDAVVAGVESGEYWLIAPRAIGSLDAVE